MEAMARGGMPPCRSPRPPAAMAAAAAAAVAVAVNYSYARLKLSLPPPSPSPFFAAISMALPSPPLTVESSTGAEFPAWIDSDGAKLELGGTGLRKKSILGLKSIVVYAFGIYANAAKLRELKLKDDKKAISLAELPCMDAEMSVRLVIVYGKLKMGTVRSAFEESIGGRIKKFSGAENKQLLQSFTQLFKEDIKLPKGTAIDMVRLPGHVLSTRIDGQEVGSVKSELLCRCLFDLYIGDEPFDVAGKEAIAAGLSSMLS
ncbi:fatty-acid-binding protein 1 [Selaginella moellendorffii]|nr:fatty-acid-binding protein 1 [Selaginella moellendorffii]|eukprot:XP_002989837.2 fatty-acid-binding protein 1 [Selaginella moellendorffii]